MMALTYFEIFEKSKHHKNDSKASGAVLSLDGLPMLLVNSINTRFKKLLALLELSLPTSHRNPTFVMPAGTSDLVILLFCMYY